MTLNELNDPKRTENIICNVMMYWEAFHYTSLVSEIRFILQALVKCRVAAVKRPPPANFLIVQIIFAGNFGLLSRKRVFFF